MRNASDVIRTAWQHETLFKWVRTGSIFQTGPRAGSFEYLSKWGYLTLNSIRDIFPQNEANLSNRLGRLRKKSRQTEALPLL